jgi:hypothetical protein
MTKVKFKECFYNFNMSTVFLFIGILFAAVSSNKFYPHTGNSNSNSKFPSFITE